MAVGEGASPRLDAENENRPPATEINGGKGFPTPREIDQQVSSVVKRFLAGADCLSWRSADRANFCQLSNRSQRETKLVFPLQEFRRRITRHVGAVLDAVEN